MVDYLDLSLKNLNNIFPCKEALYDMLSLKKPYYLPSLTYKAVTVEYLLKVAQ